MLTGWANAHPVVQIAHTVARFCPPIRKPKKWQNAPFALAAKKEKLSDTDGFRKKKAHTYVQIDSRCKLYAYMYLNFDVHL